MDDQEDREGVENASTTAVLGHIKNPAVEEVMAEAVMRSEMSRVLDSLESLEGMESRVFKDLIEREEKRKKKSRLARRMEKEAMWLVRRKEDDKW